MAEKEEEIKAKKENAYLKAILEKYKKERYKSLHNYLAEPTNASIRDKIVSMLQKGENEGFENTLKGFLGVYKIKNREDLIDEADKNILKYRAIQRLLLGETGNGKNNTYLLRLTAFLVELEQKDVFDMSDKKENPVKKTNVFDNINTLGIVGIIAVVALVIIFSLSNKENGGTSKDAQPTVTINTEHFIVSDINKIIPNQNTEFFDKNNNPQVWYSAYNNQKEFYDTAGIHPVTNKPLLPVTKEIIKTVFVEKEIVTPEKLTLNTEEKPHETSIIKQNSILNTSIINTDDNKEISLFIFDSINKIDNLFSNQLKQELKEDYKVTGNLILPSQLNSEVIERLKAGDLNYFNNDLQKYTDFICVGSVHYDYSQSAIQTDLIVCEMQVNYSIISTKTGEITEMYSNTITGSHFSKTTAKNNAIKKFTL